MQDCDSCRSERGLQLLCNISPGRSEEWISRREGAGHHRCQLDGGQCHEHPVQDREAVRR
ncbi:PMEI [Musa troglodytarum]|uniref:PMEI n=1 Tax=Musa troglodytarum TaxID=320322 RepID=A0A9E7F2A3_9LILI|nr:PMEI [Musa troglodytarum]